MKRNKMRGLFLWLNASVKDDRIPVISGAGCTDKKIDIDGEISGEFFFVYMWSCDELTVTANSGKTVLSMNEMDKIFFLELRDELLFDKEIYAKEAEIPMQISVSCMDYSDEHVSMEGTLLLGRWELLYYIRADSDGVHEPVIFSKWGGKIVPLYWSESSNLIRQITEAFRDRIEEDMQKRKERAKKRLARSMTAASAC